MKKKFYGNRQILINKLINLKNFYKFTKIKRIKKKFISNIKKNLMLQNI